MKLFWKTKDGVIDDLLRAYVSRPTGTDQVCSDFDPDLANAYIERSLTVASLSRYEKHLSECAACRKNVVALTTLTVSEASPLAAGARREARPGPLFSVKRMFGSMSSPQWAMAAAAVIVLAISLPLLLSPSKVRLDKAASESVAGGSSSDKAQTAQAPLSSAADLKSSGVVSSKSETPASKPRDKRESDAASVSGALAVNTPAKPAEERAASEQTKGATKEVPEPVDRIEQKSKSQVAAQAPAQTGGQAVAEGQRSKTDSDSGRQQQGKDAAQTGESKQARADEGANQKQEARAEAAPPPAPASGSEAGRSRGGLRQRGARLALRDSETTEAVRPAEKKVYGKNFTLKDGTWTDKDFDPDKDLPVVTIIRDSNVYKEVLSKRTKLKPYFAGFSPTERAIIVYKGTVYKLIPQQSR